MENNSWHDADIGAATALDICTIQGAIGLVLTAWKWHDWKDMWTWLKQIVGTIKNDFCGAAFEGMMRMVIICLRSTDFRPYLKIRLALTTHLLA